MFPLRIPVGINHPGAPFQEHLARLPPPTAAPFPLPQLCRLPLTPWLSGPPAPGGSLEQGREPGPLPTPRGTCRFGVGSSEEAPACLWPRPPTQPLSLQPRVPELAAGQRPPPRALFHLPKPHVETPASGPWVGFPRAGGRLWTRRCFLPWSPCRPCHVPARSKVGRWLRSPWRAHSPASRALPGPCQGGPAGGGRARGAACWALALFSHKCAWRGWREAGAVPGHPKAQKAPRPGRAPSQGRAGWALPHRLTFPLLPAPRGSQGSP